MKFLLIVAIVLATFSTGLHTAPRIEPSPMVDESELQLLDIITKIEDGDIATAEVELSELISRQPNFRLAHLVYGDLMLSRTNTLRAMGGTLADRSEIISFKEEINRRITHLRSEVIHTENMIPDVLLKVSASQKQVIVIDEEESRAHVFRNDGFGLSLVEDYFATFGRNGAAKTVEGDGRTPTGVYFITSRLNPLGLDDLYGDGALPLNYPNELDQLLGRTGYGIWLHGVPNDTYNRPLYATQGCIALVNSNIVDLYNTPNIQNTPVIITQSINWVSVEETAALKEQLLDRVEEWRIASASGGINKYDGFYSSSFSDGVLDNSAGIEEKGISAISSSEDSLELSDISLYRYPGDENLVVASFDQNFSSPIGSEVSRIRQYWTLEAEGVWKILHEGTGEYEPVHFKGIPEAAMPIVADMSSTN